MAAIVSTRIIALEAISPRQDVSPVIEPMAVAPVNGAAFQGGQTDYDTGVGFFLGRSGGAYKLSIGDPAGDNMTWTAATGLTVAGTGTFEAGVIGGWTINSAYLAKDTGVDATSAGMAPLDYPFFAGATYANRASAPFRVVPSGSFYAEDGTFGGDINTTGFIYATGNNPPGAWDQYTIVGDPVAANINAIIGSASGTGYGVSGLADGSGYGVLGANTLGTGKAGYFAGNASSSAVEIVGGAGQYALELSGSGTAYIPGLLTGTEIKLTTGAADGYVLTSDVNGLAAWEAAAMSRQTTALFFAASTTYTIPADGTYLLSALGAGGSGGAIFQTTNWGAASGGGGGGFAETAVALTAGTVLTITIGAGGAGVSSSVSGTGANGNAGGNTTISGAGVTTLTANGGAAGAFTITPAATASGGTGGTASGGTVVNATGGRGGNAVHTNTRANATGGGASGSPFGTGGRGGDISANPTGLNATGGGAVHGFQGGDLDTGTGTQTGGAGTGSSAPNDSTVAGVNSLGLFSTASADGFLRVGTSASTIERSFDTLIYPFLTMTGGGAASTAISGTGAGSGGNRVGNSANAGVCGGTGGSRTNGTAVSGTSACGGGSGGTVTTASGPATSGNGGIGLVTIERVQ